MLTQKSHKAGDIISFRVSSGEEIVGKFVAETAETIEIAKPIAIGIQMTGQGQAAIAFMPFMASVDDSGNMTFFRSNLVTVPARTRKDVEASYIQATTGLTIPTSGGPRSLIT
jgi:hypothetical protein